MKALALERKAWLAWRRKNGYGKFSQYEKAARRSRWLHPRSISENRIARLLSEKDVVVFGDDRSVPEQQETILKFLPPKTAGRSKLLVLADRYRLPGVLGWCKKNRIRYAIVGNSREIDDRKLFQEIIARYRPGVRMFVFTGALRTYPNRIPALCRDAAFRSCFVCLEPDELRWKIESESNWILSNSNIISRVASSPLLAIEQRKLADEGIDDRIELSDLERTFMHALARTRRRMGDRDRSVPQRILHPFDLSFFHFVLSGKCDSSLRKFLIQRVLEGESAVIPAKRWVFLGSLELSHIAEEAAHFARTSSAKNKKWGPWATLVEETLAFLASTWTVSSRRPPGKSVEPGASWDRLHIEAYQTGHRIARRWEDSGALRDAVRRIWQLTLKSERDYQQVWNLLRAIAG